jgi:hypothetical protein
LSEAAVSQILQAEISERVAAARECESNGHPDRAQCLREEADALSVATADESRRVISLTRGRTKHATRQLRMFNPQCGRELCALARVNMGGIREPSRSSGGDFSLSWSPARPAAVQGRASGLPRPRLRRSSEIHKPARR